ncbi:DUF4145 domain-containing protein [Ideonella azotifigens]|uniref:DUF4145 domain-containing protein n=1 Tax=Ideonella azotifigens TaxID=513160 RepID=UPI00114443D4|nr:DUF4145 domain-containing protein [Ideonella azotifigens]MCD2344967.1 DUF4145 domain-containing protein [Ideonella azotifigens]
MLVKLKQFSVGGNRPLSLRCPACRKTGTFQTIENVHDLRTGDIFLGQRFCPDPSCRAQVFCVYDLQSNVVKSYPPQRIDFDSKAIPATIVKTFEEALSCQAEGMHVAAAIMIRRTLEELCQDKGATGANLKARVNTLQSSVVLPQGLLAAMDDLRLLGNDAAHIEAQTYDAIGQDELEVAIELTKEILKAVYQLDDLLGRLRALKKT